MKAYPSVIYYRDEVIADNYYTLKFENGFPALNWELSEYTLTSKDDSKALCEYSPSNPREGKKLLADGIACQERVRNIQRLVLDKTKLPVNEEIFRLAESNSKLIVTEHLKNILLDNKITGVAFIPIEVTDGSSLPFWTRVKGLFTHKKEVPTRPVER